MRDWGSFAAFLRHGVTRAAMVQAAMRGFPVANPAELASLGRLLILAPHPDDETLGCGGLMAQAQAARQAVHVLVITDGGQSHPSSTAYPRPRLVALRQGESLAAAAALGIPPENLAFLGVPDGATPRWGGAARELVARIAAHAQAVGAQTLLTTWPHDPHADHAAAGRLGERVARQLGIGLFYYPVWGWTLPAHKMLPATPLRGLRVNIGAELAAKRRAIDCHRSQAGTLIEDDPSSFHLADEIILLFLGGFEVFVAG